MGGRTVRLGRRRWPHPRPDRDHRPGAGVRRLPQHRVRTTGPGAAVQQPRVGARALQLRSPAPGWRGAGADDGRRPVRRDRTGAPPTTSARRSARAGSSASAVTRRSRWASSRLARSTGEQRYLDQAALFVERRGRGTLGEIGFGQAYFQDDMPIREATVFRGHAVRALYLAAGAVDVAVETGDDDLLATIIAQWEATIARRTYLTGGMGSHHTGEAFGDDFVLPPDRAYSETCAGIASVMLAWRLLLATGEPRFADLIERTLHNVVATSPAPDGRAFFYANPLHQRVPGAASRRRRREQAGLVEPARAVVPRRLLPDQRGADAGQPGGVPRHRRRRRHPDPPVRRQPRRARRSTTVAGSALEVATGYPRDGAVTIRITEVRRSSVGADAADPELGDGSRGHRSERRPARRRRRQRRSSSGRSPSATRSRSPSRSRLGGRCPIRGSTPSADVWRSSVARS